MNPPSRYEKIWLELKSKGTVQLTANPFFHAKIIKAVIKRKHIDAAFRIQMLEENQTATLEKTIQTSIITFTLVVKKLYQQEHRYQKELTVKEI